jgi:hypothetical protein
VNFGPAQKPDSNSQPVTEQIIVNQTSNAVTDQLYSRLNDIDLKVEKLE